MVVQYLGIKREGGSGASKNRKRPVPFGHIGHISKDRNLESDIFITFKTQIHAQNFFSSKVRIFNEWRRKKFKILIFVILKRLEARNIKFSIADMFKKQMHSHFFKFEIKKDTKKESVLKIPVFVTLKKLEN